MSGVSLVKPNGAPTLTADTLTGNCRWPGTFIHTELRGAKAHKSGHRVPSYAASLAVSAFGPLVRLCSHGYPAADCPDVSWML